MPDVLRSSIADITTAIKARLVAKAVIPDATLVKIIAGKVKQEPAYDSNLDILLWVRGFVSQPQEGWQTGAGRVAVKMTRRIDLIPRTRLNLDSRDRQEYWLLGTADEQGYFPIEELAIDALLLWTPMDAYGNELTCCPIHLLSGTDPEKEDAKAPGGWGWSFVSFKLEYLLPCTQGVGQT